MKIALASDWYAPRVGGLEIQMRDLAHELIRRGHEVEIICATDGEPGTDTLPVHRINAHPRIPYGQLSWQPRVAREVSALITDRGYDLVHCHSAFSPLALMACNAARKAGIASVLTEHSILEGAGTTVLGLANRLTGWTTWPDVLSAVCSVAADELRALSGRTVQVLPDGISPDDWQPTDHPHPPPETDPLTIVSVMRLMPRKLPLDFVRAIPRVLSRINGTTPPRFMLIGDGPLRTDVEALAKKTGISQHLTLTGLIGRDVVRDHLSTASIFVLPTIKEALSISTLEALSSGLPVVVMAQGGVRDIVTHGEAGFLARNSHEFADHIATLVHDTQLRRQMAGRARGAAQRFAWPIIVERHMQIYEEARTLARLRKP